MSGLLARAPMLGRPDALCQQAWAIGDAMVSAGEGRESIDQLKHLVKDELNKARAKRAELDRLTERYKLLTAELEKNLAPASEG